MPDQRLRNLTPHGVVVYDGDAVLLVIPAGPGPHPRVGQSARPAPPLVVDGVHVPLMEIASGEVENLPDAEPGVLLIVSRLTAQAAPHRNDLVFPHEEVRDGRGQIIGCRSLATWASPVKREQ